MKARPIVCTDDGYRFWVELCPHLVGKDDPTGIDYPCTCCGNTIGPLGLTNGKCDRCVT